MCFSINCQSCGCEFKPGMNIYRNCNTGNINCESCVKSDKNDVRYYKDGTIWNIVDSCNGCRNINYYIFEEYISCSCCGKILDGRIYSYYLPCCDAKICEECHEQNKYIYCICSGNEVNSESRCRDYQMEELVIYMYGFISTGVQKRGRDEDYEDYEDEDDLVNTCKKRMCIEDDEDDLVNTCKRMCIG